MLWLEKKRRKRSLGSVENDELPFWDLSLAAIDLEDALGFLAIVASLSKGVGMNAGASLGGGLLILLLSGREGGTKDLGRRMRVLQSMSSEQRIGSR